MTKKVARLTERYRAEILAGSFGASGDRFPTTRELAAREGISVEYAHRVLCALCEAGALRLVGKRYCLLSGQVEPSSTLGRRLAARRQDLYLMPVREIDNPFASNLAERMSLLARSHGDRIIVFPCKKNDRDGIRGLPDLILSLGVKGVFFGPGTVRDFFAECAACPVPAVSLGTDAAAFGVDSVTVDNYSAGGVVARHLLDVGCTEFAYVGYDNPHSDERRNGFLDRLALLGVPPLPDDRIIALPNDGAQAPFGLGNLLALAGKGARLGIFCYHDLLAVEVIRKVNGFRNGRGEYLRIPDDVAVVGFDDLYLSSVIRPRLTTQSYPFDRMTKVAFDALAARAADPRVPARKFEIPFSLMVRESTVGK